MAPPVPRLDASWQGRARWAGRLLLCALASCGGQRHLAEVGGSPAYPRYDAPGPPDDPWGPYIREAAGRFDVPERWVREVIRQESGGRQYLRGQPITSDAGAAGLMQLMPATYAELRGRYGLGDDPYQPHDNILAGTAYIGELYRSYGSPAFLAAYNAGPHRLDTYLSGGSGLPNQTVDYLASVAPRLGRERALSGPLAAYADDGQVVEVAQARPAAGIAALPPVLRPPSAFVPRSFIRPPRPGCWHDPDAAYDPDAPCAPASPPPNVQPVQAVAGGDPVWARRLAIAAPPGPSRFALIPEAAAATPPAAIYDQVWAVQVGAFSTPDRAREAAEATRTEIRLLLASTRIVLRPTSPFGGRTLYRARLSGLSARSAAEACSALTALRQPCVTVPPGG